jgi:nicotinamide-nucleotide amidase
MADDAALYELASAVVSQLSESGKAVATAESCSGGWLAKAITDVPGSSACFGYGIVSYSNGAKESLLGVANKTLVDNGSVSEAVVKEMATGALNLSGADIAVAVSGVAGPDGGSDAKPVGTVWFAWAVRYGAKQRMTTDLKHFDGDREAIRELTVAWALRGILERLDR